MLRKIKWAIHRRGIRARWKVKNSIQEFRMRKARKFLRTLDNPMWAVYSLRASETGGVSQEALALTERDWDRLNASVSARIQAAEAQKAREARRAAEAA